ncbi:MAG: sporulation protein YtfJ [Ruminococcaceae bacterium]|nr:sporulation protein YtfJ [Oscillospiraceae bacterium]
MADMPLSDVIRTSLENIKKVLDGNTVIGEPITVLEDTAIVPVSKISVGFASAGAEYNGKKEAKTKNFGGGGGTGVTLTPVCFIVVNRSGDIKMLNVDANSGYSGNEGFVGIVNAVDELINKAPGMVEKVKDMFAKDDEKEENK